MLAVAWRSSSGSSLVPKPSRQQLTTQATASVTRRRRSVADSSRGASAVLSRSSQEGRRAQASRVKLETPDRFSDTLHEPPLEPVAEAREQRQRMDEFVYVPDDVIKEFEAKLQGDLQSVFATLFAGIGVITWWRGVWALLDHYVGDSVFGHWMCVITGLMIILYIRFSGYKLTNFFPPS